MSTDITNLPPQDSMLAGLERLARDTSIPTDRITELFRLAERREQTLLRRVYFNDMNALQQSITQIMRDKPNPAFSSRYATEEQIDKAARPEYTRFGFSITFGTEKPDVPGNIRVTCTVAHRDGYFESHALEAPAVPANRGVSQLQAVGGTITYLKRTLLRMVLNLVTSDNPEDDDGNGHGGNKYERWLDQFAVYAANVADNDQARDLLNRESALKMITEMPTDNGLRQRYLKLRAEIETKWLAPTATVQNDPANEPRNRPDDIEGL